MQRPQLELWSAEPHPPPQPYPQLTLEQRSHLVHQLARLILKQVQASLALPNNPAPCKDSHER